MHGLHCTALRQVHTQPFLLQEALERQLAQAESDRVAAVAALRRQEATRQALEGRLEQLQGGAQQHEQVVTAVRGERDLALQVQCCVVLHAGCPIVSGDGAGAHRQLQVSCVEGVGSGGVRSSSPVYGRLPVCCLRAA